MSYNSWIAFGSLRAQFLYVITHYFIYLVRITMHFVMKIISTAVGCGIW